jgi:hypothetical protein
LYVPAHTCTLLFAGLTLIASRIELKPGDEQLAPPGVAGDGLTHTVPADASAGAAIAIASVAPVHAAMRRQANAALVPSPRCITPPRVPPRPAAAPVAVLRGTR